MKCMTCGKKVKDGCKLDRQERIVETPFCSYECYLKYWEGIPFFKPLKKHKVEL